MGQAVIQLNSICVVILGLSSWEQTSGLQQLAHQHGGLSPCKTWEGLKGTLDTKQQSLVTFFFQLMACCSSFKRFSWFSCSRKKSRAILKCRLSGTCCQNDLWLFQEIEYLHWFVEQRAAACLMATCTGCAHGSQRHERLHHAELGEASRKYHIWPSNAAA